MFKVHVISISLIIIIASIAPNASPDTEIILDDDDILLEPVVFGNRTTNDNFMLETYTVSFSVTDDGRMFTVSHHPGSGSVHGPTEVTLIAWGSDGAVLWSRITDHFDRKYYDVTHDGSFVYVVGRYESDILVEKYSFEGNQVWNATIDLGQTEKGYEILVMEDGTIIIGGARWDESPANREYILLALNQTGQMQWSYVYERYPSPCYGADSLYITTGDTLEKLDSNGALAWSVSCNEERLGCTNDDVVYTISSNQLIEYYEEFTLPYTYIIPCNAEITITSWNADTGEESISSNLRLFDAGHQQFNSSWVDTEIDQDGLIWILMKATELSSWYLMRYDQTSESTSFFKVYEDQWNWVQLEMDDSGNAYIATTSDTYGYVVMKFDAAQLSSTETPTSTSTSTTGTQTETGGFFELTDLQVVSSVIVGVAIFDAVLIIYLKRKVAG